VTIDQLVADLEREQLDPQEARPDDRVAGAAPTSTFHQEFDWKRRLYEALGGRRNGAARRGRPSPCGASSASPAVSVPADMFGAGVDGAGSGALARWPSRTAPATKLIFYRDLRARA
jgi:hypothetical protein